MSINGTPAATNTSAFMLDPKNRPPHIKERIDLVYNKLRYQSGEWGFFNGRPDYGLFINTQQLMKTIIKVAPDREDFYAMDIGAGNFKWGQALAQYLSHLQEEGEISSDICVNIFSLRGEMFIGHNNTIGQSCYHYKEGSFEIEELSEECRDKLREHGKLENEMDIIASVWTPRHVVDPVGMIYQARDLLREKTGVMLIDGFYFDCNKCSNHAAEFDRANNDLMQLFSDMNFSFLTQYSNAQRSLNQFALQKSDNQPIQVPMRYDSYRIVGGEYGIGSDTITSFCYDESKQWNTYELPAPFSTDLIGDRGMYDWFDQHSLFEDSPKPKWKPLSTID